MPTRLVTFTFVVMTTLALAACPDSETQKVAEGDYTVSDVQGHDATDLAEIQAVTLAVDRSTRSAVFTLSGGSQLNATWSNTRGISGCPTMSGDTQLEVLEIEDATLVIGSMEFVNPVLTSTCDNDIVLREADSTVNNSGWCSEASDKCLLFEPAP